MSETEILNQRIKQLEERVAALERIVDGLGDALRPPAKQRNARLTRWMND